ncbi:MAG: inositol monophosphatase [Deltaproteobacteria bacterium]|nr:inositol monophosphatase [Deltaproteobacteria bacterium]
MSAHDLEVAIQAAKAASAIHQAARGSDLKVSTKSTAIDLVTRVDTESEEAIRSILLAAFPGDGILGEEGGERNGETGRRWLVDPLDGTLNYAHGFPWYCVSIALEVDGDLQVAVVLDSAHDELFHARRGHGAWLGDQRLCVSSRDRLDQSMVATGFAYRPEWMAENVATFARMMPKVRAIRRPGAAALDLASLAAGRLDGFWEIHLNPWDVAAGVLLIEEAGGRVSGPGGLKHELGDKTLVASNGPIHEDLLAALQLE